MLVLLFCTLFVAAEGAAMHDARVLRARQSTQLHFFRSGGERLPKCNEQLTRQVGFVV